VVRGCRWDSSGAADRWVEGLRREAKGAVERVEGVAVVEVEVVEGARRDSRDM